MIFVYLFYLFNKNDIIVVNIIFFRDVMCISLYDKIWGVFLYVNTVYVN